MREQCYLDLKVMYKYTKVDVDIADRNWTSKTPTQPLSSLSYELIKRNEIKKLGINSIVTPGVVDGSTVLNKIMPGKMLQPVSLYKDSIKCQI